MLAGLAAVIAVGLIASRTLPRRSHLDDAIARMDDDKRFVTSAKAGQTVADISTQLRLDGSRCREKHDGPRCSALLSTAALTAVTAVSLLDCTAPDVFDIRVALTRYLRKLRTYIDDVKGVAPKLPEVITC